MVYMAFPLSILSSQQPSEVGEVKRVAKSYPVSFLGGGDLSLGLSSPVP